MNFTIFFIWGIIVGSLIEAIRRLSNEWEWLGSITSKIPYFNTITIVLSVICVLIGVVHQVKTEIDKKQFSFFVAPESIDVHPGYSKRTLLKIVNNQDFPIYQIDLEISVEEGDLSVDDFKLYPKDMPKMESETGGVVISWDVFAMVGITNEGKRKKHIIIYDIAAHSTKEYFAEINADKMHQKSKIVFQITRTDKAPTDIINFDPFIKCQSNEYDVQGYLATSAIMLDQKRYKEAIVCCQKAIMKDPKAAEAHSNMGTALLFLNETEKAIQKFEEAIKIDPNLTSPYVNLATILIQQGKFKDAIEKLKVVAARKGPDQPEAFAMWGQCLAHQNDIEGAIEKYNRAIELNPQHGSAYYFWGLLLKNNNDCEKALVKFQKAAEYDHIYKLDSYGMWGVCLENMGKYREAINKYQTIIDIAPLSNEAERSKKSIEVVNKKMQNSHSRE